MGVSLTHYMDFNWFVDHIPGVVDLAAHYRVAKSKSHASFHLDIWAWLYFNISSVRPV
jgi:hypothetical protein